MRSSTSPLPSAPSPSFAARAPAARRGSTLALVLAAAALAPSLGGCAAAFRGTKAKVHLETNPEGADVRVGNRAASGPTPVDIEVERAKATQFVVSKEGHKTERVNVKRSMNGGWLAVDIVTCVIPVALCIPVLVDAITGAWYDVEKVEKVDLVAGSDGPAVPAPPAGRDVVVGADAPAPARADAYASMSEAERKSGARAAFTEGIELQGKGQHAAALPKFEAAQKLYPAATHLLHIAQCQAATGHLVEASEAYETLSRTHLAAGAPEAFVKAQEDGRAEADKVKARVPTLRIQLVPPPAQLKGLVVTVNGQAMPSELVGLTRPVNPGKYAIAVKADGYKPTTVSSDVAEGSAGVVDVRLAR